ncbi:unnamed protein product [Tuber aestivum]|uniref:Uncharacterized protein n=1 Tax=Tuber aestivum TaxID=59557 RepID=A0A292PLM7_9PEZI|nr:unnamed protein product [Tuber aestivum]
MATCSECNHHSYRTATAITSQVQLINRNLRLTILAHRLTPVIHNVYHQTPDGCRQPSFSLPSLNKNDSHERINTTCPSNKKKRKENTAPPRPPHGIATGN